MRKSRVTTFAGAWLLAAFLIPRLGAAPERRRDLAAGAAAGLRGAALPHPDLDESLHRAARAQERARRCERRDDLAAATLAWREALDIQERLAPGSLALAASLRGLGRAVAVRGDLAGAAAYQQRAAEITARLAPGSLDQAGDLLLRGRIALLRDDLEGAQRAFAGAAAIAGWRDRGGPDLGAALTGLALADLDRDLDAAERQAARARTLLEALGTQDLLLAEALTVQGRAALARSDYELARRLLSSALQIAAGVNASGPHVAEVHLYLGVLATDQGELDLADSHLRRAGRLWRAMLRSDHPFLGLLEDRRGVLFCRRNEFDQAQESVRRAMSIHARTARAGLRMAYSLGTLGAVYLKMEKAAALPAAGRCLERALAIERQLAPRGSEIGYTLYFLAWQAYRRGALQLAKAHLLESLGHQFRLGPGSQPQAIVLGSLGKLARQEGRWQEAESYFARSIAALDEQLGRFGGTRDQEADFRSCCAEYYQNYIEVLVQRGAVERAFQVLESSRARSLRLMLRERDLLNPGEVPAATERTLRGRKGEYDRVQQQIASLDPRAAAEEAAPLYGQLARLRTEIEAIEGRIRRASPKLASLRYPPPLDAAGAQRSLDPGTVLLSYSVGEKRTLLFILDAEGGLEVEEIPLGDRELRRKVTELRSLILARRARLRGDAGSRERLRGLAADLYRRLVEPAASRLEGAERILVVPDGALLVLPWMALVRETAADARGGERGWQYLAEWKPVHVADSATLYHELREGRHEEGTGTPRAQVELVAFGAPAYRWRLARQPPADRGGERGWEFAPLPASRLEVERIAALFGERARAYLGEAASEERAKSVGRGVRYLHFATHATLDERAPLNSAVVLSTPERFVPGRDNGLLQAWEVFDGVRLDADLVVLSACESGLGKEVAGEGLFGLTRAFHYAGARSVVASLWKVLDRTTGELMVRFYRHLREGLSKDAALQAAQVELIRGPIQVAAEDGSPREVSEVDASDPYYWAAFQLSGDWR